MLPFWHSGEVNKFTSAITARLPTSQLQKCNEFASFLIGKLSDKTLLVITSTLRICTETTLSRFLAAYQMICCIKWIPLYVLPFSNTTENCNT